uniref:PAN2-PAN3 deadenylation complex subunit pan3-like n=1 Tax=Styela clava TaxID=7725 RepID=UPI00193A423B|nr:PAN2-PAN3 deadenylation complex subunit pan3-like [Styela clava]
MDGNGQDPSLFDHINNALVGDLPSFGMAKESKFQQLMRSNSMTNKSRNIFENSSQSHEAGPDIRSYASFERPPEVDAGLCVEAKEFMPLMAPQPMPQPSFSSTINSFESLSLSGQNGVNNVADMPGIRPNPAAREFVPRNQSAPNLRLSQMQQQSPMQPPAPAIPGIREFIPSSRISQMGNHPNGVVQQQPPAAFLSPQAHRFVSPNNARAMGDQELNMSMMTNAGIRKSNSPLMENIMIAGGQISSPVTSMEQLGNSVSSHHQSTFYAGGDSDSSLTASPHAGYLPATSSPFAHHMLPNGSSSNMTQLMGQRTSTDTPDRSSPLQARRAASHVGHRSSPLEPINTDLHPQPTVDGDMQRGVAQENFGGTTYFFTQNQKRQNISMVMPTFHAFTGSPPSVEYMKQRVNAPSFFMPNELRQSILRKQTLTMLTVDAEQDTSVPAEVDNYHSLFPLEPIVDTPMQKSSTFSFVTSCYKAIKYKDGLPYCLRRIHGFRQVNQKCMVLVEMWKKIQHANIVMLREVFTSKAFGEHSLIFSHDYHADAETLMSRHFQNPNNNYASKTKWNNNGGKSGLLPESLIWTYVVQLTSALRCIHSAGLACRVMDPTKIIITGKSRLRVNGVGIFDVLGYDSSHSNPRAHMPQYQQDDLVALGKVVLALACNSVAAFQRDNFPQSLELVVMNYSTDLKNFILYLLTPQQRPRSVNDIMPMIGARFYTQLDSSIMRSDVIENELAKEVENGRLFRVISKLCIINERPGLGMERDWSETGDRYLLKLFRDHVFHQVSETGAPWIDMAHIVQCLNKLDAGVPEKICLMSRDEQNVLVVSYADLKKALNKCLEELTSVQEH